MINYTQMYSYLVASLLVVTNGKRQDIEQLVLNCVRAVEVYNVYDVTVKLLAIQLNFEQNIEHYRVQQVERTTAQCLF